MMFKVTILAAFINRSISISEIHTKIQSIKSSHTSFFLNRNWDAINRVWRHCVATGSLPKELETGSVYDYSDCDLREIEANGEEGEFVSKDSRYINRKTYALRIGYDGTKYSVRTIQFAII